MTQPVRVVFRSASRDAPAAGEGLRVALYQGQGPVGTRQAVEQNLEGLAEVCAGGGIRLSGGGLPGEVHHRLRDHPRAVQRVGRTPRGPAWPLRLVADVLELSRDVLWAVASTTAGPRSCSACWSATTSPSPTSPAWPSIAPRPATGDGRPGPWACRGGPAHALLRPGRRDRHRATAPSQATTAFTDPVHRLPVAITADDTNLNSDPVAARCRGLRAPVLSSAGDVSLPVTGKVKCCRPGTSQLAPWFQSRPGCRRPHSARTGWRSPI